MNPFGIPMPPGVDLSSLLGESSGPVNWRVAEFVATSMAGDSDQPDRWSYVESEYEDLLRAAEVQVAEHTRLAMPHLLTPVHVVSRAKWAKDHVPVLKPLIEPLAEKMATGQALGPASGGEPFANLMRALAPMMMGAQAGMLLGYMSHHVLGRYDLQLPPPPGEYALVFVAPNLEAAERDLNVIPRDFKFWVVLRDVIRAYQMAQPGMREEMTSLLRELVVSVEIDPEMAERFRGLDPNDPESMESLLSDAAGLVGSMEPAQREAVERMEAFVSLFDGYTAHVLEDLATDRITSLAEIEAAIERRSHERGEMQEVFEEMMGFDLRRGSSGPGKDFCDAVAESEGIEALNRVFADEQSKPTLQELQHPDEWIARTIGRRG